MATISDTNNCNPTITFETGDIGKTFRLTQTVTDAFGLTDTISKDIVVSDSLINSVCECSDFTVDPSTSIIRDGTFSDYSQLPETSSKVEFLNQWFQFGKGTTDFMHEDSFTSDTVPSPNGGGYVGFISHIYPHNWSLDKVYYEYIGQNLSTTLVAGSKMKASFYVGGGTIRSSIAAFGDRDLVIYGLTEEYTDIITEQGHISALTDSSVELGRHKIISIRKNWERACIDFTVPVDIKAIVIGGETSDSDDKYMCIDDIIISEESNFICSP